MRSIGPGSWSIESDPLGVSRGVDARRPMSTSLSTLAVSTVYRLWSTKSLRDAQCTSVSEERGDTYVSPPGPNVDPGPKARCVISSGRAPHISPGASAHDVSSASPAAREGGCPIKMAVRRPYRRSSSPPHDTVTDDGEVIAPLFPNVKDDLGQAPRQRDARDLFPAPLFHGMKPRAERAGPADSLRGGQH
jgi:hypothetical protein